MSNKPQMEAHYGRGQQAAFEALGRPKAFRDCVAIIFGKGGDSGYWMRLLGNDNFSNRRVGSLVVTPQAVAYAEMCTYKPKPRSTAGLALLAARGASRAFGSYLWTASRSEIESVSVRPIVSSPHGAYAAVDITAHGEQISIGVDVGRPHIQTFLCALRHLGGVDHDVKAASAAPPRTDGLYLMGANTRETSFQAWYFDGAKAALLDLNDPRKSLDDIRGGKWEVSAYAYRQDGDQYFIDHEDPDLRRHALVTRDGRLLVQAFMDRGKADEWGEKAAEFQFVSDSALGERWGLFGGPSSIPAPAWNPVLTTSGDMVAEELGHPKARVKG